MTIRFGIVGCGAIHGTHIEALRRIDGAKIEGVFDVEAAKARKSSESFGFFAFKTLDLLLESVDAVCVCTPSGIHAETALKCISRGKHVIVEKPADVDLRRATEMANAAQSAHLKLAIVSQHRFSPAFQRLREATKNGSFGKLLLGDATVKWFRTQGYYDSDAWRGTRELDGGCLMNQAIHYIDQIQWVMGGVESVNAHISTLNHAMASEDAGFVFVRYRNGALGTIEATTCAFPGFQERVEVHGTFGSAIIEGDEVRQWIVDSKSATSGLYGGGVTAQPAPNVAVMPEAGSSEASAPPWGEGHRMQLEDFVRSIADDRAPCVDGFDGLEPLRIVCAAYKSAAKDGRLVRLQN